jgi:N-acyl-phosphatidylethanolamine-hydrolysing phospholipase D
MLVTINGVNILTDPIWSDFASPMQFMGPKRYMPPALDLERLNVDVVLLSHTHYDHMDWATLQRIGNKAMWIVPMGVKALFSEINITRVHEMDWWQHHVLDESSDVPGRLEIVFTPTKHWTSRTPFDRNTCLWGSFAVLSPSGKFFFGGDTAYHPFFKIIGDRYGPFDFAALPIGAYKPRWFMKDNHVNPAEAVQIHTDIKAKQTVAIHWGTFPLSDEDYIEPALELGRVRKLAGVSAEEFFTLAHGETWIAGQTPKLDFASINAKMFDEYMESCERSIQEAKNREMAKEKKNASAVKLELKEL